MNKEILEKLIENKNDKLLEIKNILTDFKIEFYSKKWNILNWNLGYSLNHNFDYNFIMIKNPKK